MTADWLERFNQACEACPACDTDCQGKYRPDFCADPQDPAQEDSAVREFYWYHSSIHENWPETMSSGARARKTKALHVGTYEAAIENMFRRMDDQDSSDDQFYLYRVQLDPNCVIKPGVHPEPTNFVGDAYLAKVCAPGTNVFRYVNVHEAPSSVSLAIEPDAIRAVQGIPIPLAVDATDPWVLEATARLSKATSKPAPQPKGKLQQSRLREDSALATEARWLESKIADRLPLAVRERFTVGFDEAGFDAAPTAFPTKLVGLERLVTAPGAVLDALDAQPWRVLQTSEGEAVFSR